MPIITTNVPGCKDVIDHGVNGIIVQWKYSFIKLAPIFTFKHRIIFGVWKKC